jgi:hypothetical protein
MGVRRRLRSAAGRLGVWAAFGGLACGGDGPEVCDEDPCACGQKPDLPLEPVREPAVAFDVWQGGAAVRHEWLASAGDTIECRQLDCERGRMTLVFAAAGGAPRLELDACSVIGNSLLPPFPFERARADECEPDDRGFVARWIDGQEWRSAPSSPACQLNMTFREGTIAGTFECGSLRSDAGEEVRLGTGSFECTVAY